MAGQLGALTVSLGLDAAEYTKGLNKAERDAYEFGRQIGEGIRNAATAAATALASLGVSAGAAVAGFKDLIEGAGKFADLADKTGASAEALASFAVAAGVSGTSMDKVASATNTLTRNLVGVNDESKNAGAALKALGIPLQEFKALKPEEQIEKLATTFAGFEDGAGKSAVAMALFGKSGAEVLPFLKTLEEQGGRQVILTQQQIDQADEYADRQAKAKAELLLYAQALATQAIPAITAFTGALTDTIKEMLGVGNGANSLASNNGVQTFAENAVKALAFIIDAADGVKRTFEVLGKFIGGYAAAAGALLKGDLAGGKAIGEAFREDISKTLEAPLFSQRLAKRLEEVKGAVKAADEPRKQLSFNGPTRAGRGGRADDPTKRILDNDLKDLERAAKDEQDLLASRNRILDLYNSENLISVKDYYAGKRAAQEDAVAKQSALYDQEIELLRRYQSQAAKATDREAAQGKINALLDKKADLSRKAGEAFLEWSLKEERAADNVRRQVESINAQLLELQGNTAGAAEIRVRLQNKDVRQRLTTEGDTKALESLDAVERLTVARAQMNDQNERGTRILNELQRSEERVSTAQQIGAVGELTALQQVGDARRQAVAELQAVVAAKRAIAAANPDSIKLAEEARQAEDQLKKLSDTADVLGQKFDRIFGDAFGDAFASVVDGSKSAKEAFKGFANTVFREMASLIAKNFAKDLLSSVFGQGEGGSSGLGGFLSGVLGGGKTGSLLSSLFGGGKGSKSAAGAAGADPLGDFIAGLTAKGGASAAVDAVGKATDAASSAASTAATASATAAMTGFTASISAAAAAVASETAASTAMAAAVSAMSAASSAAAAALTALSSAAATSSASLAASGAAGAVGGGDTLGGFIAGLSGARAGGGPVSAGNLYRVNELGPELLDVNGKQFLMMGNQSGRVTAANDSGRGGTVVHLTQNFPAGTNRQTADQAALSASRAIQRSQRNA